MNTGISAPVPGSIAINVSGTETLRSTTALITAFVPVRIPNGTPAAPGLRTANEANTGIFAPAAGTISIDVVGVETLRSTNSLITANVPVTIPGLNGLTTSYLKGLAVDITGLQLSAVSGVGPFNVWTGASNISCTLRRVWTIDNSVCWFIRLNFTKVGGNSTIQGYGLPFSKLGGLTGVLALSLPNGTLAGGMSEAMTFTKYFPDGDTLCVATKIGSNMNHGSTYIAMGLLTYTPGFV